MASFLVPQKLDYITRGFDRTTLRWYNFERLALNGIPYRRDPTSTIHRPKPADSGPSGSVLVLGPGQNRKHLEV